MKIYLLMAVGFTLSLFTAGLKLNRFTGHENSLFAYRSSLALKNEDTWFEGNHYAGRVLMLFSTLLIAIVLFFFLNHFSVRVILYSLFIGLIITFAAVYMLTERHLRDIFFRDGSRRPKF
jgi:hypothetical protein